MIILEYIKIVFVVVGSIVIAAGLLKMTAAFYRKTRLYKMANEFLNLPGSKNEEKEESSQPAGSKKPFRLKLVKISDADRDEFLSKVSIEDISSDPFLKEVVDNLLSDTAGEISPEPVSYYK